MSDAQKIFDAARWYVRNRETVSGNAVAEIRSRYELTLSQAVQAIRHANASEQRGE
ncbi:hypothetical protein ACLBWS_05430 [Brucellaceae bacterium D45D]